MPTEQDILTLGAKVLNEEIRKGFAEQGHTLTGIWEKSLSNTSYEPNEIEGWAPMYGSIVDAGIEPGRIPFGGQGFEGTGGVGIRGSGENETFHPTSKYIQGLFNFWKLRKPGISDKEALSLAFATARVQKREGMSTIASRAFSKTGERQKFLQQAFNNSDEKVSDIIFTGLVGIVNSESIEQKEIVY